MSQNWAIQPETVISGDGIDNLLKDYKVDISKAADSIMTQLLKVKEVLDKRARIEPYSPKLSYTK